MQTPVFSSSAAPRPRALARSAALLTSVFLAGTISARAQQFQPLSSFTTTTGARLESAEILAYTPHDNFTVLSTVGQAGVSFGVQILSLREDGSLSEKGFADFTGLFGEAAATLTLSSVDVDPLDRGFGVASLVPTTNNITLGKVVFFDYRATTENSARSLAVLDVGYHPDSVKFSLDGMSVFVANEGEWNNANGAANAPGSISWVNLAGIETLSQVSTLTNAQVRTYDFSAGNLASGVTLAGLRNPSIAAVGTGGPLINYVPDFEKLGGTGPGSDPDFYRGIEPEFITQIGNRLFVTLQENNAIAVFDLTTEKWEKIFNLGKLTQTVDASDRDGANAGKAAKIDQVVKTLPMPDAIASYEVDGVRYLVTANEGDFRTDDRDRTRFADSSLNGMLDDRFLAGGADAGQRANSLLGRTQITRIDGDTNGDGKIDEVVLAGSRSFSIWNAETGMLVWDSGSGNGDRNDATNNPLTNLETVLLGLDPTFHNSEEGKASNFDGRSPQKGPEPEALTLAVIGGRTFALLGMERQNGLLMYDISNPAQPVQVGYTNAASRGLVSPESMIFVAAANNPTGKDIVLTGYELNGGGIGVDAVPEPGSALLLTVGACSLLGLRRRRAVGGSPA
jgi:hypothetical protein